MPPREFSGLGDIGTLGPWDHAMGSGMIPLKLRMRLMINVELMIRYMYIHVDMLVDMLVICHQF